MLPPAPAVICDIGGGYGEYAFWLSSLGYEVYLYDISEKNIEMAYELSKEYPCKLKGYSTACMAFLSQKLLDEGWKYCGLYADCAYPYSNKVNQRFKYIDKTTKLYQNQSDCYSYFFSKFCFWLLCQ